MNYDNAFLYIFLPLKKIPTVSAACLAIQLTKGAYITPVLLKLHWLPECFRSIIMCI